MLEYRSIASLATHVAVCNDDVANKYNLYTIQSAVECSVIRVAAAVSGLTRLS